MNKKMLGVSMAVVFAVSLLGGCGTKTEAGSEMQGTLKVYAWTQMATALTETADRFMEKNPGVEITVEQVDASYTKLLPELASGTGVADIFMTQNTDILSFANKYEGQLMDLSELVEPEKDNFVAAALEACHNQEDGKYYGVPIDIGPCGLLYRTDIFEEAGVKAEDISTWDDYIEAGKKIVEATGGKTKMTGFNYNGASSQDYIKMLFAQQGGSYYEEDGKVNLASGEMIQASNMLNKMIDAGIMMDFPDEWNDRITALNNSQICTLPYPAWYAVVMKDSVADQAGLWKYAPMPSFDGENRDVCLGGSVLAISANTEYPEIAKEFVKFSLMNADQADILYKQSQYEAYKPYWNADCYNEVDEYFGVAIGKEFSQWTDAPVVNFGASFTDITTALSTATGEMFINGVDPETALTDATEAAQTAIDNN